MDSNGKSKDSARAAGSGARAGRAGATVAAALAVVAVAAAVAEGAGPPKSLLGSWMLLRDEGGMAPAADAVVVLTFASDGKASLYAARGTSEVVDRGTYTYTLGKVTLNLPDTAKSVTGGKVDADGALLTLPFRVFDAGAGRSIWKHADPVPLAGFASGVVAADPASAAPAAAGDGAAPAGLLKHLAKAKKAAGVGATDTAAPVVLAGTAVPGADGASGVMGMAGKGGGAGADGMGAAPPAPPPPPAAAAGSGPFAHLAGRWTGRALGGENRFRKDGSIAIYAKHVADFWLDIDPMGVINGMVEMRYSIDVDRAGGGAEARLVADFVEAWQKGGTAPAASMVRYSSGLPTTVVKRTFPIKGYVDPSRNELILALIGDLGSLDYTYTVGTETKVKPFPAWSPFFAEAGAKVGVSGSTYVARFEKSGVERKKPWQEYWYAWSATLSR